MSHEFQENIDLINAALVGVKKFTELEFQLSTTFSASEFDVCEGFDELDHTVIMTSENGDEIFFTVCSERHNVVVEMWQEKEQ